MVEALRELVAKDFGECVLAFVPTAANAEGGDKRWLIHDLNRFADLGFKEMDIVDVSAMPRDSWLPRLQKADVVAVGGGNTSYLMAWIKRSGLAEALPALLTTRVYVGISAGSMVMAPKLKEKEMQRLYEEPITDDDTNDGLGFVDFLVVPHMNSPHFPRVAELIDEVAKGSEVPFYAIDDASAVKVADGATEVVSEGAWKRYN